jgi:hypothetical protein
MEELIQALQNAHMEAAQMEWLNESALSSSILGIPSSEVRNNGPILIA